MTDQPTLDFLKARGMGLVVMVDNDKMYTDPGDLLSAVPAIAETPLLLAQAINHLAQGFTFAVIDDAKAFEVDYRATLEAEEPGAPWKQGVYRLRDFGVPDFADVTDPAVEDGTLSFTVRDTSTGLPYRVTAVADGSTLPGNDAYKPLALKPVDDPRAAAQGEAPAPEPKPEPVAPAKAGGDS